MSVQPLLALAPVGAPPELNLPGTAAESATQTVAPLEAQRFAQLLSAAPQSFRQTVGGSGSLLDAAQTIGRELGSTRSLLDIRSSMLASVDLRDPIGTMFALTDHSMEAHAMFARLHISSGLASAATNLFGTLLKNQQ